MPPAMLVTVPARGGEIVLAIISAIHLGLPMLDRCLQRRSLRAEPPTAVDAAKFLAHRQFVTNSLPALAEAHVRIMTHEELRVS